jgi:hypothetical protein
LFSTAQTDSFDSIRPLRQQASQRPHNIEKGPQSRAQIMLGQIRPEQDRLGKAAFLSDLETRANTHMGMTFSHLLPGIAKFAAATIAPWFSVDSTLIRNAVILLLSFVILAVAVAIIARKMRQSTAASAFRRSVKAIRGRVEKQRPSTDWQMLQSLEQAIDKGSASLDFDVAGRIADPGIADRDQHASNFPALSPAEPKPSAAPESAWEMLQETPLSWDETASSLMAAFAQPETVHESRSLTRSTDEGAAETALRSAQNSARNSEPYLAQGPTPAREENASLALPRLSELRGMCFSQALRDLDRAKRHAQPTLGPTLDLNPAPTPEIDALLRAIAPFESLIMQMESATHETENTDAANENGAKKYPPESDFLSVEPVALSKARGQHGEDNGRSLPERKPPGGVPDQMQILPSRRGQYKKKT